MCSVPVVSDTVGLGRMGGHVPRRCGVRSEALGSLRTPGAATLRLCRNANPTGSLRLQRRHGAPPPRLGKGAVVTSCSELRRLRPARVGEGREALVEADEVFGHLQSDPIPLSCRGPIFSACQRPSAAEMPKTRRQCPARLAAAMAVVAQEAVRAGAPFRAQTVALVFFPKSFPGPGPVLSRSPRRRAALRLPTAQLRLGTRLGRFLLVP